nr:MAG: hypothetical protein [Microvirus sp.]
MKPGQVLRLWWQDFVGGRLRSPQEVFRAAEAEVQRAPERFVSGAPEDGIKWEAPERLRDKAYWLQPRYLRHGEVADWQQCDRRLMRWAAMVVEAARKRDVPLFVHCAFRTRAEQDRLNAEGFSRARWPNGAHNIGEAVDIVHGRFAWDMSPHEWMLIYKLGQECLRKLNAQLPRDHRLELEWGGDDGTKSDRFRWDPAHWEIKDYRRRIRPLEAREPVRYMPRKLLDLLRL